MDIANRMGFGTAPHMTKLAKFAVALSGLTDNAAFGPCALRGTPVLAEVSDGDDPLPTGISYQWHSVADGPIAGATGASFVPDAPLADEAVIFCVVTVPGRGSRTSARAVLRDAVPQVEGALFDEVFDVDTGPQVVAASSVFTGLNLRYAVTGVGAIIDPITGDISVLTDVERDGDIITVMATNSGGTASAAFQVTVEDVAAGEALPFGGLTPAGAGGIKVDGTSVTGGDPGGHWEITDGFLVPSAAGEGALSGFYALVFNNGDTLDVMIEDDKASARAGEIMAVYDSLPLTARGLMVQTPEADDAPVTGRIRLAPKAFENEMVLEPRDWAEDPDDPDDPRKAFRPVTLGGLAIGGSPDGSQYTENLTVQGFEFHMEGGGLLPSFMQTGAGTERESDGNIGVVLIENPSRHVTIRQNDIWSRTTADIVANNDYRQHLNTSRQIRGITTKRNNSHNSGLNEHLVIEENYIHDCSRGAAVVAAYEYEGVRSRFCRNIIMDVYTNFATVGYVNGIDIFDNKGKGVLAAGPDTDGYVGSTGDGPHAGIFGFDAGPSRSTRNVSFMGNVFSAGANTREALEVAAGNSTPRLYKCTGVKFNDPVVPDSYYNIVAGFNMINTRGIAFEISGADADEHILVFHNTFASNPDPQGGSNPIMFFTGAKNMRMWKNITCGYRLHPDENATVGRTLDTLEGYGNIQINRGAGDYGETDYFVGLDGSGVTRGIPVDNLFDAYLPKPDTEAMLSSGEVAGAVGTGLYHGNGVHSAVFAPPTSTANNPAPTADAVFTGGQRLNWSGDFGGMVPADSKEMFISIVMRRDTDKQVQFIYDQRESDILIKLYNNQLHIHGRRNGEEKFEVISSLRIPDDGQYHHVTFGTRSGRFITTLDGRIDPFQVMTVGARGNLGWRQNIVRVGESYTGNSSTRLQAGVRSIYIDNVFRDMEDPAQYSAVHNADGSARNMGSDGSAWFGTQPAILLSGNGPTFNVNKGYGPNFTTAGTLG